MKLAAPKRSPLRVHSLVLTHSRSLPVFSEKQPWRAALGMSQNLPTTDSCPAATATLFNHHIGAYDQVVWKGDAERFRCLEINRQIRFCGLFYRNVTWLFTLHSRGFWHKRRMAVTG